MNAAQKIYHFTGKQPAKVEEWASVYWVHFTGRRPTFYSKKIVDRAAKVEARDIGGDKAVRDNHTGDVYLLRGNQSMGYTIKKAAPGQAIGYGSEFALVRGEIVARTAFTARPKRLSEIIAAVASRAA